MLKNKFLSGITLLFSRNLRDKLNVVEQHFDLAKEGHIFNRIDAWTCSNLKDDGFFEIKELNLRHKRSKTCDEKGIGYLVILT